MHLGTSDDGKVNIWFLTKSQKDGNREIQICILPEDESSIIDYGNAASNENFNTKIDFGHSQSLDSLLSNFKITIYNSDEEILGIYYTNKHGIAKVQSPFLIWKWKVEKLGYESFYLLQSEENTNKMFKIIQLNYSLI